MHRAEKHGRNDQGRDKTPFLVNPAEEDAPEQDLLPDRHVQEHEKRRQDFCGLVRPDAGNPIDAEEHHQARDGHEEKHADGKTLARIRSQRGKRDILRRMLFEPADKKRIERQHGSGQADRNQPLGPRG